LSAVHGPDLPGEDDTMLRKFSIVEQLWIRMLSLPAENTMMLPRRLKVLESRLSFLHHYTSGRILYQKMCNIAARNSRSVHQG
jgi:hypothetical protein